MRFTTSGQSMSPAAINMHLVYQERIKQLEHKLRCLNQTLVCSLGDTEMYDHNGPHNNEHRSIDAAIGKLSLAVQDLKHNLQSLRVFITEEWKQYQNQLKDHIQSLLNHLQELQYSSQCLEGMNEKILTLEQSLSEVHEKYRTEKLRRKILHNNLIELKGNIRVFCRIRPCLPFDKQKSFNLQESSKEITFALDDETVLVKCNRPGHLAVDKIFHFERVFSPCETQCGIFEEVRPLITSVLDGYNVCIMAYGQTGSGKTHTMMGPHSDAGTESGAELGLIPRTAEELFRLILERPAGCHSVEVSIVEVYNNEIYDLLAYDRCTELSVKRDIITSKDGKSDVPSLTYESASNTEEVLNLVQKGLELRVKHSTLIHANSSRSHLVVTLTITTHAGFDEPKHASDWQNQKSVETKLQLVDLAGSECVGMSGVQGAALREASFINRSLSALSDVLAALSERRSHVPYRNSKLTHLLQDSIGGDAKLLIMLCISPCQKFITESLQTLGFGTRACQVPRVPVKKRH
ncbi:kinesin-like protein KIF25 isoform X2 [Hyperolius riggenbachi]|uniref:kinesin-like protein KIF25 isoform X2 n=1 Tax=Hyperolius riggenbachi TaxID=752182 RepID=UPI0035A33D78